MKGRTQGFLLTKEDPLKVDGSQTLILNFKIRSLEDSQSKNLKF
jgi:hypothetical protein